jgi:hypothetical protein
MNLCKSVLVEQASESLVSGLLGLFFIFLFLGRHLLRSVASRGSRSSRGIGVRVGNAVLQLLYLRPAVFGLNGNGQNLLVAVDNGVYDGWQGWEVGSQRDASDGGNCAGESLEKLGFLNVENVGREGVALVVDLGDTHSVGEGRDVQHVEKSGLGCSDLASSLDELQVGRNFDGTTSNLGWDTESLEERGLSRFHTSVTSWDEDIGGSDCTSSGRSSNLVGENLIAYDFQIAVGEDESNVALDERKETLKFWAIYQKSLDGATDL